MILHFRILMTSRENQELHGMSRLSRVEAIACRSYRMSKLSVFIIIMTVHVVKYNKLFSLSPFKNNFISAYLH